MLLSVVPLQVLSLGFAIFVVVSVAIAAWVWRDAGARFPHGPGEGWVWAAGTLVALPVFLPIYLIAARPVGHVIHCPSCGRGTLSHRAACLHCDHPLAFDAAPATWGMGEVVGVSTVFMVSLPVIAQAAGVGETLRLLDLTIFGLVQNVLFVGLVLYVARVRYRQPLSAVGLRFDRWLLLAGVGVIAGAVTVPLSTFAEQLAVTVIGWFVGASRAEAMAEAEHASDILTGILRARPSPGELIWILILVCVVVPVGEEMFFRGFVYGTLRRWGIVPATALSALFFGAAHQQVVHFFPIVVLGAVLAGLYERTGSLAASMAVHGVNNLVAVLSLLYGWNI